MRPVVLLVGLVLGAAACTGSHERQHDAARAGTPAPPQASLDVPQLLALSVDELTERIGPRLPVPASFVDPTLTPSQIQRGGLDSTTFFRSQGLAVVASYDHRTRRVNDLLLLGSNENELMRRGRLQLGSARYLVLPVFETKRPTHLLGLRVLATAPN